MRALTICCSVAVLLTGCAPPAPEPGVEVFTSTSTVAEPSILVDAFVSDAVSVDRCVLTAPGVVEFEGDIDLGLTGVTSAGPTPAELVLEITLGGTVVDGTLVGMIEKLGSFSATLPLEELHGATAAAVVESRIDSGDEFEAACRAMLLTRQVRFLPAAAIPLVAAPGVELREP